MRIFGLYLKRIVKRRLTLIFMVLLPVLFTFMVVTQYNDATKVTLAMYVPDPAVDSYVSAMLEKQDVTLIHAKDADSAIQTSANLGIVFTSTAGELFDNPGAVKIESYAKEVNFNSKSLEVKLNSIFSSLQTLASNAPDAGAFQESMKLMADSPAPVTIEPSILGNPNAVVLTSTFNMIVFIMLFLTMTNTLLFLGDKVHSTTERVLLTAKNKLSYYLQTVSVFAAIGIVQFLLMIALMSGAFGIDLELSAFHLLLLVLAYGLLNVIAAGIGLLLVSRTTKQSTGRLLVTVVSLPLAMLGGTLWPSSIMPEGMQRFARILPTRWITELNTELFSGFTGSGSAVTVHFVSLLGCAALIFLLLTRVKTQDI
ncbi:MULTISPECIES: ABC transporter permease [unclassified Paenibacillus]|uniref:ABC transporter permease n=1 Tax=unclassified Paenibacillus TaxID=185978 RepID=UPI002406B985|nr:MULTISPECIES: ABC transporter permease [unclassified Paenibacillus]MDF9843901.1 ABC-type multidrug transport system permease subunit [Paenibacillus sp. PastF-2]MDF9850506.1 ABC-type multidrug transport system permease subunit [Paenibacillus sp. PastM-2]MDF9856232.1 ABC-type multidrug transport system permease subunit [Paenibacillus sp. PastF-1]MDH6481539.1 ABC-type multidrug transport system permease subunit [Paenibacillus sp. PastH-2]MDH6509853.1 ABC-type multidrug transport system permeas